MPGNIKNNNVRSLHIHLLNDEYWDFMLYKGEAYGNYDGLNTECLSSYIDTDNPECFADNDVLCSTVSWDKAINNGAILEDIGMTGVDNGLIKYDKDYITRSEFLNLYTNSKIELYSGNTRFFLTPVTGNTKLYSYDTEIVSEDSGNTYIKLNGGFYQGFFKLNGFDYQTLPTTIEDEWNLEFTIRPRDYEAAENAVNKTHPENAGIFFYMGTRAENKFAEIYNGVYDNKKSFDEMDKCPNVGRYEAQCNDFLKQYIKDTNDADLRNYELETSDGYSSDQRKYSEIKTDNKFLFFNRTCTGFTTHTWEDGNQVIFEMENRDYIDNPFLLYNRTCTGYTARDYEKITVPSGKGTTSGGTYDMNQDIMGNAFALKINEDGSISYRYTVKDCDSETKVSTLTESTLSGLVKTDEWVTIHVRFVAVNGYVDECGNSSSGRKMKIYIYLNGYLVFISKEVPVFNFKALNEASTKQEGVPFNISLGGGTQGLSERIWLNYFDNETEQYEIEKNYMGTFIGDFKSFKFYTCENNIGQIRTNYNYEKDLLWER